MLQPVLDEKSFVEAHGHQSPEIVNEMIELMAHKVLTDETRDISNHEQLVVTLRWVSENYDVNEDFLGFRKLDSTTADSIYSSLKIVYFL